MIFVHMKLKSTVSRQFYAFLVDGRMMNNEHWEIDAL